MFYSLTKFNTPWKMEKIQLTNYEIVPAKYNTF